MITSTAAATSAMLMPINITTASCAMSESPGPPPNKRALIFESYGWKDAGDIAKTLSRDLQQAGYDVWIDVENIKPGEPFPPALAAAIDRADMVLALLSPHSVRLHDDPGNTEGSSVVLNELAEAHGKHKPIVPVMVIQCSTPFILNILRKIDFTKWSASEETYREGFEKVRKAIESALAGKLDDLYVEHIGRIRPLNMDYELLLRYRDFVGREWLFQCVKTWLATDRPCLLIEGDSGTGKSAFAAELIRRNPDESVFAYHFCTADRPEQVSAGNFVRSIAAIIGGQDERYGRRLIEDPAVHAALMEERSRTDPVSAFIHGVLLPLRDFPPSSPRYIVVDALDEALAPSGGIDLSIPAVLRRILPDFPSWLRLVVTTRDDQRIMPLFPDAEIVRLSSDETRQDADITLFVASRFAEPELSALAATTDARDQAIAAIAERSDGNFRYAQEVVRALAAREFGLADVTRLPNQLSGLYYASFARRFPTPSDYRHAEICLSVLLAAREPLTEDQLVAITGLDRRTELQPALIALTGYVTQASREPGAGYVLFHTSIADWLLRPPPGRNPYSVDPAQGRAWLVTFCRAWRENNDPYALRHLIVHLVEHGLAREALATVQAGFFRARAAATGETRFVLEDALQLTLALLARGDATGVMALAGTTGTRQRDGVAAALMAAPAEQDALVATIVDLLLRPERKIGTFAMLRRRATSTLGALSGRTAADRQSPGADVLNARIVAMRAAEARGFADALVLASRDKSPQVRVFLIPLLYRFWKGRGETGWALVKQIADDLVGPFGIPNGGAVETFGHLSLAILNHHREDAATMDRLLAVWRDAVNRMFDGLLARVLGRGWLMRVLVQPLAALMDRQPDYQPLNAKEIVVTFSRPDDFRTMWEAALGCFENPERGIRPIVDILTRRDIPFDLFLMLCCERAIILHAKRDPDAAFDLCDRVFQEGCPWFQQSVLYALFHILTRAQSVDEAQLSRYKEMTSSFFAATGATMQTTVARYSFARICAGRSWLRLNIGREAGHGCSRSSSRPRSNPPQTTW